MNQSFLGIGGNICGKMIVFASRNQNSGTYEDNSYYKGYQIQGKGCPQ